MSETNEDYVPNSRYPYGNKDWARYEREFSKQEKVLGSFGLLYVTVPDDTQWRNGTTYGFYDQTGTLIAYSQMKTGFNGLSAFEDVEVRSERKKEGWGGKLYRTLLKDAGLRLANWDNMTEDSARVWLSMWKDERIDVYAISVQYNDGSRRLRRVEVAPNEQGWLLMTSDSEKVFPGKLDGKHNAKVPDVLVAEWKATNESVLRALLPFRSRTSE